MDCVRGGAICLTSSGIMTYCNGAVSFLSMSMVGHLPMPVNVVVCYSNALIASIGLLFICSCIRQEHDWSRQLSMSLLSIVGLQEIFFMSWLKVTDGSSNFLLNATVAILIMGICYLLHKLLVYCVPWCVGIIKKK